MEFKRVKDSLLEFVVVGVSLKCTTSNAASSYQDSADIRSNSRILLEEETCWTFLKQCLHCTSLYDVVALSWIISLRIHLIKGLYCDLECKDHRVRIEFEVEKWRCNLETSTWPLFSFHCPFHVHLFLIKISPSLKKRNISSSWSLPSNFWRIIQWCQVIRIRFVSSPSGQRGMSHVQQTPIEVSVLGNRQTRSPGRARTTNRADTSLIACRVFFTAQCKSRKEVSQRITDLPALRKRVGSQSDESMCLRGTSKHNHWPFWTWWWL